MNTMTTTKIVGGLCGALLVFLLLNWAGESIYRVGPAEHGGEGEEVASAYEIIVAQAETTGGETAEGGAEAGPTLADLLPAADVANGEKVFGKCKACHKLDGSNSTGPALDGIVDDDVAVADGFNFSAGMAAKEGNWTPDELFAFLAAPKAYVDGTKMGFAGLKKPQDRADVIAYLQSLE
jgi:cytochrome c